MRGQQYGLLIYYVSGTSSERFVRLYLTATGIFPQEIILTISSRFPFFYETFPLKTFVPFWT